MGATLLPSHASLLDVQLRAFAAEHGTPGDAPLPTAAAVGPEDWLAPLWTALDSCGVELPGLEFAASTETTALGGVVAPILANSPDVSSLLDSLVRFHPLVGRNQLSLRRTTAPASAVVTVRALDGGPAHPDTVDACFAMLCTTARRAAGPDARPSRVLLRRAEPPTRGRHAQLLGPVAFGQPADACVFGPDALAAPVRSADPVVLAMLAPYAQRQLARERTPWSVAVRSALDHEGPRLADVARALAVAGRTLQLRLREEGHSFSELAEAAQRERALALLAEPAPTGLPVTVVAARAGFATPAALTRAVRRWTGMTPSQFRTHSANREQFPG